MRVFIHNVNTYTGSCLCETLGEVGSEQTEIYGTVVEPSKRKNGLKYGYGRVTKVVSKIPKDNIVKQLLRCDLIIFTLHNTDVEELEYIIRKLKYERLKRDTTLVLISSIMTWNKTKRRFSHQGGAANSATGEAKGQTNSTEEEEEEPPSSGTTKHINVPEVFTEKDYMKRIPSRQYEQHKSIETLILSLNSRDKLNTYVVASGILYGNGESVFFPIFKNAWLSLDSQIIDRGNNFIPLIHVRGLCQFVKELYMRQPERKYLIAVDNEHITQKTLVKTVGNFVSGNNTYVSVSPHDSFLFDDAEVMCVNLRFACSQLGGGGQADQKGGDGQKGEADQADEDDQSEEGDQADEDDEDGEDADDPDAADAANLDDHAPPKKKRANQGGHSDGRGFTFHCCEGFTKNIGTLAREFCQYRSLKQLRVLILGQPGVGKTFIAKKICQHYNLTLCSISSILEECKQRGDDFPEYYKQGLSELNDEQEKKKKNVKGNAMGKAKGNAVGAALGPASRTAKLTLPDLTALFYQKLQSNECKFRGFVLDFFPRNYDEAEYFFERHAGGGAPEGSGEPGEAEAEAVKGDEADEADEVVEADESNEADEADESDEDELPGTPRSDPDQEATPQAGNTASKKQPGSAGATPNGDSNETPEEADKVSLLPEFVIVLKSPEELCRSRMMNLAEEEIIKGHNDESGFERRHKKYIKENCRNDYFEFDQKKSIEDFFLEREVDVLHVHINEDSSLEDILTNIHIYIEKNVKFDNFLPSSEEMLKDKLQQQEKELSLEKEKLATKERQLIGEETIQNDELIKAEKKRQELLLQHQQQYFHNQSIPLRFYLIKNILPILTDALIHICRTKPKNPCLHIAQYLLENAHKYNVEEAALDALRSGESAAEGAATHRG
ncbi:unnamed protein product [Plasmodium vivax]|uniref:P-loop containing nucleoside triphosphate hydrolase n=2 Tax=Plasmodium vivax TaxID=5855 RepID=A0A0J9WE17_PLAVI|nr:hypothetical protein PVNG_05908 [Plasmodium vivax North Korean]CAG9479303.1 unnamed protein product [Plasmodium vivax]